MAFNREQRIISDKEQEQSYASYAAMEDIMDKLKILNYEEEFLNDLKMKPFHKYYFIIPKNPGEQFYLFSALAAWLLKKLGDNFPQPQESDDPNETISKIVEAVLQKNISVNFSHNKLKQGVGEQVVYILDQLTTQAIKFSDFNWETPGPIEEKEEETEVIEDESEINLERIEEEMIAAYSEDSDEENLFHIDDIRTRKKEVVQSQVKSDIDEEAWKLELERVQPHLRITIRYDNRDWRSHLEQMKQYKENIESCLIPAQTQLERIHKDIASTMDKIKNREKYLNRELDSVLAEYRQLQDQLAKIKDKYSSIRGGVTERTRNLAKLTDELETIKQQMEERGSSMTDGTPLVNIKKSVAKIKSEIVDMDVRIGVLECILLQTRIRDEKQLENEFGQTISVF